MVFVLFQLTFLIFPCSEQTVQYISLLAVDWSTP
jgi:hypothetical protein